VKEDAEKALGQRHRRNEFRFFMCGSWDIDGIKEWPNGCQRGGWITCTPKAGGWVKERLVGYCKSWRKVGVGQDHTVNRMTNAYHMNKAVRNQKYNKLVKRVRGDYLRTTVMAVAVILGTTQDLQIQFVWVQGKPPAPSSNPFLQLPIEPVSRQGT